jgi:hypothetical protein
METDLLEALSLAQSTTIIRAEVHQPKIRYHILYTEPSVTSIIRLTIDLAKLLTSQFLGPQKKGIIFCTSRWEANTISDTFTKCTSHSDVAREDRNHMEAEWFSGHKQWIAATTGMIHGVDHSNVGAVIFVGLPYGLINVYQGAGRAARNGEPAVCFLITKALPFVHVGKYQKDVECRYEGDAWVANREQCRRIGLSQLMDGKPTDCLHLSGCEPCDICEPNTPLLDAIQSIIPDPEFPPTSAVTGSIIDLLQTTAIVADVSNAQSACQTKENMPEEDYSWLDMDDDLFKDVEEATSNSKATTLSVVNHEPCSSVQMNQELAQSKPYTLTLCNTADLTSSFYSSVSSNTTIRNMKSLNINGPHSIPTTPSILSALSSSCMPESQCHTPLSITGAIIPNGPPAISMPSLSVLLDVATLQLQRHNKYDKSRLLSHMVSFLLQKCVICWALRKALVQKTSKHQPFIQCREGGCGFVEHAIGWIAFKKKLEFKRYKYCYYCGTPQESGYQPTAHPIFKPGEKINCPMEDFAVLLIWHIRHDKLMWAKAVKQFWAQGLSFSVNNSDFAKWCSIGDNDNCFNNGIELVIWFWLTKSSEQ